MLRETLINRFLKYVKIDTQSDSKSTTFPSTASQLEFGKMLKSECESLGLVDVSMDAHGYVFATLPATTDKELPTIGFIAHMDTAPDFSGKNVNPQMVSNYDGEAIILNKEKNIVLSPTQFPVLKTMVGEDLITTDGTTLLGADDKAGIASIMTACEYLLQHPEIQHGPIRIGFTPDEEVGHGVDHFDVARFGADFAYTIDGGTLGEIQSQSFNAAGSKVTFSGVSVHPGSAKDKLINSILLANEYNALLPSNEVPERTEGYEGFFMLHDIKGGIEETTADYIIRDHSKELFAKRKEVMTEAAAEMNKRYGEGTVTLEISDSYYNMKEIIDQHPHIMALANEALSNLGVTPTDDPIRGGTDGSRLSFMGLPCPNIFTGGYNFHGRFEFVVLNHFEMSCKTIIEIAKVAASK
ncbi:MAG: peptidase T [Cellulosilyticaceae bacterium]